MNINATLLGQFLTFAFLVWFTMKYVWPPILRAMNERDQRIADGLAAAERGQHDLEVAQHKAAEQLRDAKIHAAEILDLANKRANQIIEESKERAREEGERLLVLAKQDIDQEKQFAKQQLRHEIASLALAGAEKILVHSVDEKVQRELVDKLLIEMG